MRFLLQFYGRMSADNFDLFHHDRGAGLVVPVGGDGGNLIDDLNALHHMAESSVACLLYTSDAADE